VLNASTLKVVHRSLLRPAKPDDPNLRAESLGGESKDVIQSWDDINNDLLDSKYLNTLAPPPIVDPDELIGRTFLMDAQPDCSQFRARIVKMIEDNDYSWKTSRTKLNFSLIPMKMPVRKSSPTINWWTTWQKMTIMTSYGNSSVLFHI
jgi:hypothetical protein